MTATDVDRTILPPKPDEVILAVEKIRSLYEQLLNALQRQIGAMRKGDLDAMQYNNMRQEFLSRRIGELERKRQWMVERVGLSAGLDGRAARSMSLRSLAEHYGEPYADRLRSVGDTLREVTAKVSDAHTVLTLITREMLDHLSGLREAMTNPASGEGTYDPEGNTEQDEALHFFDAVG